MSFADSLFGRPLATSEERAEHIGAAAGVPIFGLDALTSAAYGPETALALLIPLGAMGVEHLLPIVVTVLCLLVIVFFSYRQTIAAYPNGGGSYTVASENLGSGAGLVAAAALMIDYILTAAVGISAGIDAVVSDQPWLHPHILALCLFVLVVLALINMRGTKESAAAFMIPTTMFVGTLAAAIVVGVFKVLHSGGHPVPAAHIPAPLPATASVLTTWMLLKAFSLMGVPTNRFPPYFASPLVAPLVPPFRWWTSSPNTTMRSSSAIRRSMTPATASTNFTARHGPSYVVGSRMVSDSSSLASPRIPTSTKPGSGHSSGRMRRLPA